MKYFVFVILFFAISTVVLFSCAKWKDPEPKDLGLTNPYCNDPAAVNYNWGFPGRADNSVCFYPNSLFVGTYMYYDSVYRDTLFIGADSTIITLSPRDPDPTHSKLNLAGICGLTIWLTALPGYQATVDTLVGDTTTMTQGQLYCGAHDTLNGIVSRSRLDSPTLLRMNFIVVTDSVLTTHNGTARKL